MIQQPESSHQSPIDITKLLDDSPWSTYQKIIVALVALAVIFDGLDIQILGFAIPSLLRELHATRAQFGPVLALGLVGMIFGGPLAGYCGDRFGRRPTLIGCVVVFGLGTLATAFVKGFLGLTIFRLITGMGTGGALPNVSALIAEFTPIRRRATAVKLALVCVPLGGMLAGSLASWILPSFGWRGLYVAGGMLPLFCALILVVGVPESPCFLACRPSERSPLKSLLTRLGRILPPEPTYQEGFEARSGNGLSPVDLFRHGLARDTTCLWIAFMFCLASIYLVFGWLPAMLTASHLDVGAAASALAAYNLGGVLGILLWSVLVPKFGSRIPLVAGSLGCAVSALGLLVVPVRAVGPHVALTIGVALNGLLANAVQVSLYALAANVYHTGIRATGVAYAGTIGRIGGLLSSLFGAAIIQAGRAAYWEATAMAMACACASLIGVGKHYPAMRKNFRSETKAQS